MRQEKIILHDKAAFTAMRRAGSLAAEVLDMITDHVTDGVTTGELDQICHDYILAHMATPAPLNYKGFPK
ncbi:MAG: type I methionyl aminopeptidase, partial [Alphaproteobacteria bacterium]|nr:type I methionyl aminopeptidase [Alphaproteobacteria bacterium]